MLYPWEMVVLIWKGVLVCITCLASLAYVVWILRPGGNLTPVTNGRKCKRRPLMKPVHLDSDSDEGGLFSEDSLVSGNNSHSSSRPSSGSRRRRRQAPKAQPDIQSKRQRSDLQPHSSEEYTTSENDGSIYSEDSLTQGDSQKVLETSGTYRDALNQAWESDHFPEDTPRSSGASSEVVSGITESLQKLTALALQEDDKENHETLQNIPKELERGKIDQLDSCYPPSESTGITCESNTHLKTVAESNMALIPDIQSGGNQRPSDEYMPSVHHSAAKHRKLQSAEYGDGIHSFHPDALTGRRQNMVQSPTTMWSGGGRESPDSEGTNKVVSSGDQQQHFVRLVPSSPKKIWNLSIQGPEVWTNNSYLPFNEDGSSSDESSTSQQQQQKQSLKRTQPKNQGSGSQQQKLSNLFSKYGLLHDKGKDEIDSFDGAKEDSTVQEERMFKPVDSLGERIGQLDGTTADQKETENLQPVLKKKRKENQTFVSKDHKGNIKFEVTINQDETNVVYNVGKTEYKTYALRDTEGGIVHEEVQIVPDTININLTETTTFSNNDKFESITKERVLFQREGSSFSDTNDVVVSEKHLRERHFLEYEQDRIGESVSRESSVERRSVDEDSNSRMDFASCERLPGAREPLQSGEPLLKKSKFESGSQSAESEDCWETGNVQQNDSTEMQHKKPNGSKAPGIEVKSVGIRDVPIKIVGEFSGEQFESEVPVPLGHDLTQNTKVYSTPKGASPNAANTQHTYLSHNLSVSDYVEKSLHAHDSDGAIQSLQAQNTTNLQPQSGPQLIDHSNSIRNDETVNNCLTVSVSCADVNAACGVSAMSPTMTVSSGHYSYVSDDQEIFLTTESGDDTYYSLNQTGISIGSVSSFKTLNSSDSSEYKTPQQSPRQQEGAMEKDALHQLDYKLQPTLLSVFRQGRKPGEDETYAHHDCLPSEFGLASDNEHLQKELKVSDEAIRQALKKEVEKKIARLERRVRSLSDSAISSDFTESESASVSPRCSRLKEPVCHHGLPEDIFSAHAEEIISPLYASSLLPSHEQTLQNQVKSMDEASLMGKGRKYVDQRNSDMAQDGNLLSGFNNGDQNHEKHLKDARETRQMFRLTDESGTFSTPQSGRFSGSERSTGLYPYSLPLPKPSGRFPERLVNAILAIKEYPQLLNPSMRRSLLRKRLLGRLSKSLDDIHSLEKAFQARQLENSITERANLIMETACQNNLVFASNVCSQSPSEANLWQGNLHHSAPESVMRSIMAEQLLMEDALLTDTGVDEADGHARLHHTFPSSDMADISTSHGHGKILTEEHIRKLLLARMHLSARASLEDLQLSGDDTDLDTRGLNCCQKRLLRQKSPSESNVCTYLKDISKATTNHPSNRKNASFEIIADLNESMNKLSSSNDSLYLFFVNRSIEEQSSPEHSVPSSPRKRPVSYKSTDTNDSTMHHARSETSIQTCSDRTDFESSTGQAGGELIETILPLSERSASLDDIYHQRLHQIHRESLRRSHSADKLYVGGGVVDDPDEQIFPPAVHFTDVDAGSSSSALEGSDLENSQRRNPSVVSSVGFFYRKASHPRSFQGFEEEARKQLAGTETDALRDSRIEGLGMVDLSPRESESSEYSSDSYFRSEVESGTPYFKEFKPGFAPVQSENASQTDHNVPSSSTGIDSSSDMLAIHDSTRWASDDATIYEKHTIQPEATIPLSKESQSWHQVSYTLKETTDMLKNIQANLPTLAFVDLDSSDDSFHTVTVNGQVVSRDSSPRKKVLNSRDTVSTQTEDSYAFAESPYFSKRNLSCQEVHFSHDSHREKAVSPMEVQLSTSEDLFEHESLRENMPPSHTTNSDFETQTNLEDYTSEQGRYGAHGQDRAISVGQEHMDEEEFTYFSEVQKNVSEHSTQTAYPRQRDSMKIIIKVKDTMTQTGLLPEDIVSEAVQTDGAMGMNAIESTDELENIHLSSSMCQTDERSHVTCGVQTADVLPSQQQNEGNLKNLHSMNVTIKHPENDENEQSTNRNSIDKYVMNITDISQQTNEGSTDGIIIDRDAQRPSTLYTSYSNQQLNPADEHNMRKDSINENITVSQAVFKQRVVLSSSNQESDQTLPVILPNEADSQISTSLPKISASELQDKEAKHNFCPAEYVHDSGNISSSRTDRTSPPSDQLNSFGAQLKLNSSEPGLSTLPCLTEDANNDYVLNAQLQNLSADTLDGIMSDRSSPFSHHNRGNEAPKSRGADRKKSLPPEEFAEENLLQTGGEASAPFAMNIESASPSLTHGIHLQYATINQVTELKTQSSESEEETIMITDVIPLQKADEISQGIPQSGDENLKQVSQPGTSNHNFPAMAGGLSEFTVLDADNSNQQIDIMSNNNVPVMISRRQGLAMSELEHKSSSSEEEVTATDLISTSELSTNDENIMHDEIKYYDSSIVEEENNSSFSPKKDVTGTLSRPSEMLQSASDRNFMGDFVTPSRDLNERIHTDHEQGPQKHTASVDVINTKENKKDDTQSTIRERSQEDSYNTGNEEYGNGSEERSSDSDVETVVTDMIALPKLKTETDTITRVSGMLTKGKRKRESPLFPDFAPSELEDISATAEGKKEKLHRFTKETMNQGMMEPQRDEKISESEEEVVVTDVISLQDQQSRTEAVGSANNVTDTWKYSDEKHEDEGGRTDSDSEVIVTEVVSFHDSATFESEIPGKTEYKKVPISQEKVQDQQMHKVMDAYSEEHVGSVTREVKEEQGIEGPQKSILGKLQEKQSKQSDISGPRLSVAEATSPKVSARGEDGSIVEKHQSERWRINIKDVSFHESGVQEENAQVGESGSAREVTHYGETSSESDEEIHVIDVISPPNLRISESHERDSISIKEREVAQGPFGDHGERNAENEIKYTEVISLPGRKFVEETTSMARNGEQKKKEHSNISDSREEINVANSIKFPGEETASESVLAVSSVLNTDGMTRKYGSEKSSESEEEIVITDVIDVPLASSGNAKREPSEQSSAESGLLQRHVSNEHKKPQRGASLSLRESVNSGTAFVEQVEQNLEDKVLMIDNISIPQKQSVEEPGNLAQTTEDSDSGEEIIVTDIVRLPGQRAAGESANTPDTLFPIQGKDRIRKTYDFEKSSDSEEDIVTTSVIEVPLAGSGNEKCDLLEQSPTEGGPQQGPVSENTTGDDLKDSKNQSNLDSCGQPYDSERDRLIQTGVPDREGSKGDQLESKSGAENPMVFKQRKPDDDLRMEDTPVPYGESTNMPRRLDEEGEKVQRKSLLPDDTGEKNGSGLQRMPKENIEGVKVKGGNIQEEKWHEEGDTGVVKKSSIMGSDVPEGKTKVVETKIDSDEEVVVTDMISLPNLGNRKQQRGESLSVSKRLNPGRAFEEQVERDPVDEVILTDNISIPQRQSQRETGTCVDDSGTKSDGSDSGEEVIVTDIVRIPVDMPGAMLSVQDKHVIKEGYSSEKSSESEEEIVITDIIEMPPSNSGNVKPELPGQDPTGHALQQGHVSENTLGDDLTDSQLQANVDSSRQPYDIRREDEAVVSDNISTPLRQSERGTEPLSWSSGLQPEDSDSGEEVFVTDIVRLPQQQVTGEIAKTPETLLTVHAKDSIIKGYGSEKSSESEEEIVITDIIEIPPSNSGNIKPELPGQTSTVHALQQGHDLENTLDDDLTDSQLQANVDSSRQPYGFGHGDKVVVSDNISTPLRQSERGTGPLVWNSGLKSEDSDSGEEVVVTDIVRLPQQATGEIAKPPDTLLSIHKKDGMRKGYGSEKSSESEEEIVITDIIEIPPSNSGNVKPELPGQDPTGHALQQGHVSENKIGDNLTDSQLQANMHTSRQPYDIRREVEAVVSDNISTPLRQSERETGPLVWNSGLKSEDSDSGEEVVVTDIVKLPQKQVTGEIAKPPDTLLSIHRKDGMRKGYGSEKSSESEEEIVITNVFGVPIASSGNVKPESSRQTPTRPELQQGHVSESKNIIDVDFTEPQLQSDMDASRHPYTGIAEEWRSVGEQMESRLENFREIKQRKTDGDLRMEDTPVPYGESTNMPGRLDEEGEKVQRKSLFPEDTDGKNGSGLQRMPIENIEGVNVKGDNVQEEEWQQGRDSGVVKRSSSMGSDVPEGKTKVIETKIDSDEEVVVMDTISLPFVENLTQEKEDSLSLKKRLNPEMAFEEQVEQNPDDEVVLTDNIFIPQGQSERETETRSQNRLKCEDSDSREEVIVTDIIKLTVKDTSRTEGDTSGTLLSVQDKDGIRQKHGSEKSSESEEEIVITDVIEVPLASSGSVKPDLLERSPTGSGLLQGHDSEKTVGDDLTDSQLQTNIHTSRQTYDIGHGDIDMVVLSDDISTPLTQHEGETQNRIGLLKSEDSDSGEEITVTDIVRFPGQYDIGESSKTPDALLSVQSEVRMTQEYSLDKSSESEEETIITDVIEMPLATSGNVKPDLIEQSPTGSGLWQGQVSENATGVGITGSQLQSNLDTSRQPCDSEHDGSIQIRVQDEGSTKGAEMEPGAENPMVFNQRKTDDDLRMEDTPVPYGESTNVPRRLDEEGEEVQKESLLPEDTDGKSGSSLQRMAKENIEGVQVKGGNVQEEKWHQEGDTGVLKKSSTMGFDVPKGKTKVMETKIDSDEEIVVMDTISLPNLGNRKQQRGESLSLSKRLNPERAFEEQVERDPVDEVILTDNISIPQRQSQRETGTRAQNSRTKSDSSDSGEEVIVTDIVRLPQEAPGDSVNIPGAMLSVQDKDVIRKGYSSEKSSESEEETVITDIIEIPSSNSGNVKPELPGQTPTESGLQQRHDSENTIGDDLTDSQLEANMDTSRQPYDCGREDEAVITDNIFTHLRHSERETGSPSWNSGLKSDDSDSGEEVIATDFVRLPQQATGEIAKTSDTLLSVHGKDGIRKGYSSEKSSESEEEIVITDVVELPIASPGNVTTESSGLTPTGSGLRQEYDFEIAIGDDLTDSKHQSNPDTSRQPCDSNYDGSIQIEVQEGGRSKGKDMESEIENPTEIEQRKTDDDIRKVDKPGSYGGSTNMPGKSDEDGEKVQKESLLPEHTDGKNGSSLQRMPRENLGEQVKGGNKENEMRHPERDPNVVNKSSTIIVLDSSENPKQKKGESLSLQARLNPEKAFEEQVERDPEDEVVLTDNISMPQKQSQRETGSRAQNSGNKFDDSDSGEEVIVTDIVRLPGQATSESVKTPDTQLSAQDKDGIRKEVSSEKSSESEEEMVITDIIAIPLANSGNVQPQHGTVTSDSNDINNGKPTAYEKLTDTDSHIVRSLPLDPQNSGSVTPSFSHPPELSEEYLDDTYYSKESTGTKHGNQEEVFDLEENTVSDIPEASRIRGSDSDDLISYVFTMPVASTSNDSDGLHSEIVSQRGDVGKQKDGVQNMEGDNSSEVMTTECHKQNESMENPDIDSHRIGNQLSGIYDSQHSKRSKSNRSSDSEEEHVFTDVFPSPTMVDTTEDCEVVTQTISDANQTEDAPKMSDTDRTLSSELISGPEDERLSVEQYVSKKTPQNQMANSGRNSFPREQTEDLQNGVGSVKARNNFQSIPSSVPLEVTQLRPYIGKESRDQTEHLDELGSMHQPGDEHYRKSTDSEEEIIVSATLTMPATSENISQAQPVSLEAHLSETGELRGPSANYQTYVISTENQTSSENDNSKSRRQKKEDLKADEPNVNSQNGPQVGGKLVDGQVSKEKSQKKSSGVTVPLNVSNNVDKIVMPVTQSASELISQVHPSQQEQVNQQLPESGIKLHHQQFIKEQQGNVPEQFTALPEEYFVSGLTPSNEIVKVPVDSGASQPPLVHQHISGSPDELGQSGRENPSAIVMSAVEQVLDAPVEKDDSNTMEKKWYQNSHLRASSVDISELHNPQFPEEAHQEVQDSSHPLVQRSPESQRSQKHLQPHGQEYEQVDHLPIARVSPAQLSSSSDEESIFIEEVIPIPHIAKLEGGNTDPSELIMPGRSEAQIDIRQSGDDEGKKKLNESGKIPHILKSSGEPVTSYRPQPTHFAHSKGSSEETGDSGIFSDRSISDNNQPIREGNNQHPTISDNILQQEEGSKHSNHLVGNAHASFPYEDRKDTMASNLKNDLNLDESSCTDVPKTSAIVGIPDHSRNNDQGGPVEKGTDSLKVIDDVGLVKSKINPSEQTEPLSNVGLYPEQGIFALSDAERSDGVEEVQGSEEEMDSGEEILPAPEATEHTVIHRHGKMTDFFAGQETRGGNNGDNILRLGHPRFNQTLPEAADVNVATPSLRDNANEAMIAAISTVDNDPERAENLNLVAIATQWGDLPSVRRNPRIRDRIGNTQRPFSSRILSVTDTDPSFSNNDISSEPAEESLNHPPSHNQTLKACTQDLALLSDSPLSNTLVYPLPGLNIGKGKNTDKPIVLAPDEGDDRVGETALLQPELQLATVKELHHHPDHSSEVDLALPRFLDLTEVAIISPKEISMNNEEVICTPRRVSNASETIVNVDNLNHPTSSLLEDSDFEVSTSSVTGELSVIHVPSQKAMVIDKSGDALNILHVGNGDIRTGTALQIGQDAESVQAESDKDSDTNYTKNDDDAQVPSYAAVTRPNPTLDLITVVTQANEGDEYHRPQDLHRNRQLTASRTDGPFGGTFLREPQEYMGIYYFGEPEGEIGSSPRKRRRVKQRSPSGDFDYSQYWEDVPKKDVTPIEEEEMENGDATNTDDILGVISVATRPFPTPDSHWGLDDICRNRTLDANATDGAFDGCFTKLPMDYDSEFNSDGLTQEEQQLGEHEDINTEGDEEFRRRQMEILDLANELIRAGSRLHSTSVDDDHIAPELLKDWDRDLEDSMQKGGELSFRKEETLEENKAFLQRPRGIEQGNILKAKFLPSNHAAFESMGQKLRSISDPHPGLESTIDVRPNPMWAPETPGSGRSVIMSTPPAATFLPISVHPPVQFHHSLSSPALFAGSENNQDLQELDPSRVRWSKYCRERKELNPEATDTEGRERSPLTRRRADMSDMNISNQEILNEIEKLKAEHGKMMDLLERSRNRKPKLRTSIFRKRYHSPKCAPDSDSSSGDSPVTVIATGVSPIASPLSHTEAIREPSPPCIRGRTEFEPATQLNLVTIGGNMPADRESRPSSENALSRDQLSSSCKSDNSSQTESDFQNRDNILENDNIDDISFNEQVNDLLLKVPDLYFSASSAPSSTRFDHAKGPFKKATQSQRTVVRSQLETKSTKKTLGTERKEEGRLTPSSEASNLSPLTIQAITDDDADSAFSMSSLNSRNLMSTGVDFCADSSDEFTQTDANDMTGGVSMDDSELRASMLGSGYSSSRDSHDMSSIQRNLDRLQRERIEIIELLSLQYLPSSLTIELLEAKLNYCIGQTDTLLATLEDAWGREDALPNASTKLIKITKEYLDEYRSQFSRTKKDIESHLETHQRRQRGTRGRRRTRGREFMNMRRRAELETFRLERLREQCRYEREKSKVNSSSPCFSSPSFSRSYDTLSSSSSFLMDDLEPRSMTPTQRKNYLINLRRQIVHDSSYELADLRRRSGSRSSSGSPSTYWAERPSSYSPARSESPGMYSLTTTRRHNSLFSPSTSLSRSGHRDSFQQRAQELRRPHSTEPILQVSSDFRTNVVASYASRDLNADRLLEESHEIRRQNQRQIEKARQVLRQLDDRRSHQSSSTRSLQETYTSSLQSQQIHPRQPLSVDTTTFLSTSNELRMRAFSRDLAPGQTSSPRVASSFALYTRDHLMRGQRRINSLVSSPHSTLSPPKSPYRLSQSSRQAGSPMTHQLPHSSLHLLSPPSYSSSLRSESVNRPRVTSSRSLSSHSSSSPTTHLSIQRSRSLSRPDYHSLPVHSHHSLTKTETVSEKSWLKSSTSTTTLQTSSKKGNVVNKSETSTSVSFSSSLNTTSGMPESARSGTPSSLMSTELEFYMVPPGSDRISIDESYVAQSHPINVTVLNTQSEAKKNDQKDNTDKSGS